eukprot:6487260-Amphidinium_carterae.1
MFNGRGFWCTKPTSTWELPDLVAISVWSTQCSEARYPWRHKGQGKKDEKFKAFPDPVGAAILGFKALSSG